MNITQELIHAQILAIDNPPVEEQLREVYNRFATNKQNSALMTVSWTGNSLWVRFDCINSNNELTKIVRVPLNDVQLLKKELAREGELEAMMAKLRDEFQAQAELSIELVAREMFHR
jgi:hypothetical protein